MAIGNIYDGDGPLEVTDEQWQALNDDYARWVDEQAEARGFVLINLRDELVKLAKERGITHDESGNPL